MPEQKKNNEVKPTYKIINIVETQRVTMLNEKIPVKIVTYRTPDGQFRSISIDTKDFTEENIKKHIQENEKVTDELVGKEITI